MILEAANKEEAQKIAANDPYDRAGLFQSVEIRPWAWLINNPEAS